MNEKNFTGVMSRSVFISLSSLITGFTEFQLRGTGMADIYFDTLIQRTGIAITQEYLLEFAELSKQVTDGTDELDNLFRRKILSDERFGPVTRNIIKLWYTGSWYRMPEDWYKKYGLFSASNVSYFISSQAYTEGLLWPAVGSHPPGAKAPGYGTWKDKPVFERL